MDTSNDLGYRSTLMALVSESDCPEVTIMLSILGELFDREILCTWDDTDYTSVPYKLARDIFAKKQASLDTAIAVIGISRIQADMKKSIMEYLIELSHVLETERDIYFPDDDF